MEDIVKERVDDATDSNADAVVNGDSDVTNLIQSKSEYKSRDKVTCQFCQKVFFSILSYINWCALLKKKRGQIYPLKYLTTSILYIKIVI